MKKNIIIFGASGGIGHFAVEYALQSGYDVKAYVRNANKIKISNPNLEILEGEITDSSQVSKALDGIDAVVWCVGIPMTLKGDFDSAVIGHEILIKAMDEKEVKRLIDWGTPSISYKEDKHSFITVFPKIMAGIFLPKAKKEMVKIGALIVNSDLDWTIVRFLAPKDTPAKGYVKTSFGDRKLNINISRRDIARFMIDQIESSEFIRRMPIIGY